MIRQKAEGVMRVELTMGSKTQHSLWLRRKVTIMSSLVVIGFVPMSVYSLLCITMGCGRSGKQVQADALVCIAITEGYVNWQNPNITCFTKEGFLPAVSKPTYNSAQLLSPLVFANTVNKSLSSP